MAFILFPFIRQLKTLTDNAPPILRIVNATIMLGHFTPITFFIPKITADRLWFLRLHYYASVPSSLICTRTDLGLSPNNDGTVIRLNIPQLTEERRTDLVKTLNKRAEESKVSVRNIRRDANEAIKKLEKAKSITEDDAKKAQEDIQKIVDKYIKEIDIARAEKEKEIMEV